MVPTRQPGVGLGVLASPFDLAELLVEQVPRGGVIVTGERGGEPLRVAITPGDWRLKARPRLAGRALQHY